MDRGRRRTTLAAGALAGAAIAFPLGLYMGRPTPTAEPPRAATGSASLRARYSPTLLSDPYVIDQWRRSVEALEASCRQSGRHCTEARAARLRLMELDRR